MEKIRQWKVPKILTGNIFVYGRPGSGKSCKLLTVAQGLHSKGWKIWDIFGGKREEGPFWTFPNDDERIWKQIESETFEFKNEGPKQYKVKLMYPHFSKKLPKKLPHNPPNVVSEVFTIPFRDLPEEMEQLISTVIGPLGSQSSRLWKKIINLTKKQSTSDDIMDLFEHELKKRKGDKLYDSFIDPLHKQGLLASEKCSTNIDLESEADDNETIFVLCLDYVPVQFRFFVMGYILKKIFDLVKNNKIHKKNFSLFREASLFMKVLDSDKNSEDTTSIFRNIVVDLARYCRSGLFLGMDTQDPNEVKGMIEGSDDLLLICEMPSQKSREILCEPLKKDRRITEMQIAYIGWKIKIHEACILERNQKAKILKRITPPRCRYWKSQYGDFYSLWKKEVNQYIKTKELVKYFYEESEKRKETLEMRRSKQQNVEEIEIEDENSEKKQKEKPIAVVPERRIKSKYGIKTNRFD